MTYDCMTPDEYALWSTRIHNIVAKVPCWDCPLWFAAEARSEGRCNRTPRDVAPGTGLRGPVRTYATEDERKAALRRSWRESKMRARQRATGGTIMSAAGRPASVAKPPPRPVALTRLRDDQPFR